MSLKVYIFLLFGISISLFFVGYKPLLFSMLQCSTASATCVPTANFAQGIINSLLSLLTNPGFLLGAGVALFVPFLIGGSFSVYYVIPILMISVLGNFLLLPTDFILQTTLPAEIQMIMLGFMNLLLLLTVIEFVRGGD
jgi:hypothetical protein